MRKLARIFGFGEDRRTADAVRSRRKRSVREPAPTKFSKAFFKSPFSKRDDVGVGMGGAIQKFDRKVSLPLPTESGVFVTSPRTIDALSLDAAELNATNIDRRAIEEVTLIVYGWENVQPGTLSWVFPSLRSALTAVRAMRNAVRWAVLHGVVAAEELVGDVDVARESGLILVEAS